VLLDQQVLLALGPPMLAPLLQACPDLSLLPVSSLVLSSQMHLKQKNPQSFKSQKNHHLLRSVSHLEEFLETGKFNSGAMATWLYLLLKRTLQDKEDSFLVYLI
jgi:hypothetical protein